MNNKAHNGLKLCEALTEQTVVVALIAVIPFGFNLVKCPTDRNRLLSVIYSKQLNLMRLSRLEYFTIRMCIISIMSVMTIMTMVV